MTSVSSTDEVFEAIQRVKSGASAFATNFFPAEARLQTWIQHNELSSAQAKSENVAFFFRKDRDFFHLYFCAPSREALSSACQAHPAIREQRLAADILSQQAAS